MEQIKLCVKYTVWEEKLQIMGTFLKGSSEYLY